MYTSVTLASPCSVVTTHVPTHSSGTVLALDMTEIEADDVKTSCTITAMIRGRTMYIGGGLLAVVVIILLLIILL